MCEKSVKIGHFSHVFHMVFHIHTPSSECHVEMYMELSRQLLFHNPPRWVIVDCRLKGNKLFICVLHNLL